MKKIKYSVSSFIIILSLMLGYVAYAEDYVENKENRNEFKKELKEEKKIREENKIKRDQFEDDREKVKDEFQIKKEEFKNQFELMLQSTKEKREEFRMRLEEKKEEVKIKSEEIKNKFKDNLAEIKDEKKKISAEKILETIQNLNIKLTNNLSEKVDRIENILVSIESRISKAEEKGLDVTLVKAEAEKAKIAIKTAREALLVQAEKVYEVNETTEANLKVQMKKLRDLFRADMKMVYEKVKLAHTMVKNTAIYLAKISNVDDDIENKSEVEDNDEINDTIIN